jgi:hypothetical protein
MQTIDLFRKPGKIELPDAPVIVCYGGGVDSTAMLVKLHQAGIRPDAITFADTGGEKPETYEMVKVMNTWCIDHGFPAITVCKYETTKAPYNDLAGNNLANETLPSLAFGMKSCSIKWKQQPQDYAIMGCKSGPNKCDPHPLWLECQERGLKPVKLIGYDAGPADLRRSAKLKDQDKNFRYRYPLQDLGMNRQDCLETIIEAGLPVPIKSACWFCPASQKWELYWLAGTHPELFLEALRIEHTAMIGKHSRWGSDECTYGKDWEELVNKPADRWPTTSITVGLGRSFAWNHWARINKIVNQEGEFIADRTALLETAERLQAQGGNAADRRTC